MHECICVCVHVFVYVSADINMGLWLSIFDGGNYSADDRTMKLDTISLFLFIFFSLQVVTVEGSVFAASVLICVSFGVKCYNSVCIVSNLHVRLLVITKTYVINVFADASAAPDICLYDFCRKKCSQH